MLNEKLHSRHKKRLAFHSGWTDRTPALVSAGLITERVSCRHSPCEEWFIGETGVGDAEQIDGTVLVAPMPCSSSNNRYGAPIVDVDDVCRSITQRLGARLVSRRRVDDLVSRSMCRTDEQYSCHDLPVLLVNRAKGLHRRVVCYWRSARPRYDWRHPASAMCARRGL